jgi:hypothetical protein
VRLLRWGTLVLLLTVVAAWVFSDRGPAIAAKIHGLCPGYHEDMTADGLPAADAGTTDPARVAEVLRAKEAYIRSAYQGVVALDVGSGYGKVWEGENGGEYTIRQVSDHAIVVRLGERDDCPRGSRQFLEVEGVPVLFAAGPRSSRWAAAAS